MRCHSPLVRQAERSNAIGYAIHRSDRITAVIRVYDADGNVIETHERNNRDEAEREP